MTDETDDAMDESMGEPMDAESPGEDLAALVVDPEDLDDDAVSLDVDLDDELDETAAVASDDPDDVEIPTAPDRLAVDEDEDEERPRRRATDEEGDDNEMLSKEDVEADLASILQEKLASSDEFAPDDEIVEQEDFTDGTPVLQPRRPDEEHCQQCFLLVRKTAPKCPVDHDLCPLFPNR
ncbi:MAG: hypothetical protein ACO3IV_03280 [Ilumatobacteraceae bacterium]